LGFKVQTFVSNSLYEVEEVSSDNCAAVNLEVWRTEEEIDEYYVDRLGLAVESFIGYVGREGIYTQSPELDFGGLNGGGPSVVLGDFLPDGSFGVEELEQYFPGGAPGYGCNESAAQWSISKCVMGRWCVL
jgi:hypothetical protein